MGVLDSDLLNMPYKLCKWLCAVEGCKGYTRVKDYGMQPYYWDGDKIKYGKDYWRGGWFDAIGHLYYCNKHYKQYKQGLIKLPLLTLDQLRSKIVVIEKSKLYKKLSF